MIQRDPKHYTAGYEGDNSSEAPLYLRSLVFDGVEGDFNAGLICEFNEYLEKKRVFPDCRFVSEEGASPGVLPGKVVVINASHDNLPTSHETARIFEQYFKDKGSSVPVKVVNTREDLMKEVEDDPSGVLLVSQCVDKKVYNVDLAKDLESKNAVIVPGTVTAPGSVFSDKDSTYRLLSDEGKHWSSVARYKKIFVDGKTIPEVVEGIFGAIDLLHEEIGDHTFFVKPHEGGGGLGGFRITKSDKGYIIPDLSKVSGDDSEIHPTFIDFDTSNHAKLRELLWIYRLFSTDKKMSENYLKVKLPVIDAYEEEALHVLKNYLEQSKDKRKAKLERMTMSKDEASKKLVDAIGIFEKKFDRRYVPLVNEHIDFGLWGLRAHYRLSSRGPVLEAMYHRIFQLGFMEEGLGYVGSDNISNKQTGELEILRLGPINEIMLEAIGGREGLFAALEKGAEALAMLAELVPDKERWRVPLRVQLDLAAISRRIGEGNADTARGISIASRWDVFVENAQEWLEDSLAYYAWKKSKQV